MSKNNYAIIMAGGVGSRFWPISRTAHPKQFIDILGIGKTLIQQTYDRFAGIFPPENIYVVTNEIYRPLINHQLPLIPDDQIIGEPVLRNTAPCIAYATYKIHKKNPEANCVIAPSDHLILDVKGFRETILSALEFTSNHDALVTLGIKPNRPDTGYGYIQFIEDPQKPIKKVKTFTEKPTLEIAKMLLESGDFLWNAGIFVWRTETIKNKFEEFQPDIAGIFQKGWKHFNNASEKTFIDKNYQICPNISID